MQQQRYEETRQQPQGTNGLTQRNITPPPCEISQAPSQGLANQQFASDPEMDAEAGSQVPGLGLVICNKYVSISSPGTLPPGMSSSELPHDMTVGLAHIKKILPHSPASRCDALAAGDEILAVNSFCCRGRTLEEIALYMTPTPNLHDHFGRPQPAKPVHIISRQCSSASRGGLRRESLFHASIVIDEPNYPEDLAELLYDTQRGFPRDEDSMDLCASLGALEEAVFDKVLTPQEKGLTSRPAAPGRGVRHDGYQTTWRSFPMISLSVMGTLPVL